MAAIEQADEVPVDERPVAVGVGPLEEIGGDLGAAAMHQRVDLPMGIQGLAHDLLRRVEPGDVARDKNDIGRRDAPPDMRHRLGAAFGPAAVDDDGPGAGRRERHRGRQPDARRGRGQHGDAAGEHASHPGHRRCARPGRIIEPRRHASGRTRVIARRSNIRTASLTSPSAPNSLIAA
ncbi:MAG: hypothetical protein RLO22_10785 [Sneathiellaceae bacterium]